MDFTPAEPLFPNLRSLHFEFTKEIIPLLHLPFPSLIRLHIRLTSDNDLSMLQDPLQSLVRTSSNLKTLDIFCEDEPEDIKIILDGICGWSNPQSVTCPQISLDMDALVHLSRMPSLVQLTFMSNDALLDMTASSDPLSFSALNCLKLHAESLAPISRLFSWIRFPAITHFTVIIDDDCPSKQDLALFMASIHMVGMDPTIQEFSLNQMLNEPEETWLRDSDTPTLDLDDLWSCMAFHRLRHMHIDLGWDVNLSDDDLLMLGSAWPQLEELLMNTNWGWNKPGITPNALARLLETCPSLTSIALAIDTRGYTQIPARRLREPVSPSSFESTFRINTLDSVIERGSMDAMAAFLASIVPHFDSTFTTWETWSLLDDPDLDEDRERWEEVHSQAKEIIKKRWLNVLCGLFFPS